MAKQRARSVSTFLTEERETFVRTLAAQQVTSKARIISDAINAYRTITEASTRGEMPLLYNPETNTAKAIVAENTPTAPLPIFISPIESRKQAVVYTRILVEALDQILKTKDERLHNRPPPRMRIQPGDFDQREIEALIAELKRLSKFLSAETKARAIPDKTKVELART